MKQPEDRATTIELPGLEPKRGRGRPRKADALTPAQRQRAKRYRDANRRATRSTQSPPAPYEKGDMHRSWLARIGVEPPPYPQTDASGYWVVYDPAFHLCLPFPPEWWPNDT